MSKEVVPPNDFPYFGWNAETTKEYIIQKPLQQGDFMVIFNSQFHILRYMLAKVENPDHGKQHRIILSKSGEAGGVTFYRTGVNCFHPKGQTVMLPPILPKEIMEHLALDCDVLLKWGWIVSN